MILIKRQCLMLAALMAGLTGGAALAQQQAIPASNAQADTGGLTGSVTDDSAWRDLGIAIPSFPTDRSVATSADGGNTDALGHNLARVVFSDLKNNGLFKPTGPDALPAIGYAEVAAPAFATCRASSKAAPTGISPSAAICTTSRWARN